MELDWLIESRRPVKMYGNMTEHEVGELYRLTYGPSVDEETPSWME